MHIEGLALDSFRNYRHLEVAFHPQMNVIWGDNAQGKTNLLEAVAYLSGGSHRARYDKELIAFDGAQARIRGLVVTRQRHILLEAQLRRGAKRTLKAGGVPLKAGGELPGYLKTVLFCPEDLYLIRDGAAARRRFLDDCLSQLRPRYAAALSRYRRLHEHKTRILRDSEKKPALLDTLEEFSREMARMGAVLIGYRARLVRGLQEKAPIIHRDFSGGSEELSLRYETVSSIEDPLGDEAALLSALTEHQRRLRDAEIAARQCLSGPHKDDLAVFINGESARTFASQGQTRTAALSLKLAARELFFRDTGEYPVLLLDDVLSELDARRQEFVLNRVRDGQVMITCCEDDRLRCLSGGAVFRVRQGEIRL